MTIDREMLDTCAPALVCDYPCSAQIKVDPQGLALRQAASILAAKIGSGSASTEPETRADDARLDPNAEEK